MQRVPYVDLMAFPAPQMQPPIFAKDFPRPAIIQFTAAPPITGITVAQTIDFLKKTINTFKSQPGVVIIKSRKDLDDLRDDQIGVILGLQQPPQDAETGDLMEMRTMLGLIVTTIAYKDNESRYGGGFLSTGHPHDRLTVKGWDFIQSLHTTGMWLDLSHAGHQTARDCLKLIRRNDLDIPVLASHTGAYSMYANPRNLPDDVLKEIALQSGVVGTYCLTFGLDSENDSLTPFYRHLNHIRDICGSRSVCIGTDGIYQHLSEEEERTQFAIMQPKFDADGRMRSRFPVESPELNTHRKDKVISAGLGNMMSVEDKEKIMSRNALRFLRDILR